MTCIPFPAYNVDKGLKPLNNIFCSILHRDLEFTQNLGLTLLAFANSSNVILSETELDRFIVGFRLGARFAYDAFVDNSAPYRDYLKEEFE